MTKLASICLSKGLASITDTCSYNDTRELTIRVTNNAAKCHHPSSQKRLSSATNHIGNRLDDINDFPNMIPI